jgi:DNA-binding Lrp family transcriptional regulator
LFAVGLGLEEKVLKKIRTVEGVQEAYVSYGMYDLIAKIKTNSMKQPRELVTSRLRKIANVRSTLKLLLTIE